MRPSNRKAAAFQRPPKFNFLKERTKKPGVIFFTSGSADFLKPETGNRRYWPLGSTPDEARREIEELKSKLKTMISGEPK